MRGRRRTALAAIIIGGLAVGAVLLRQSKPLLDRARLFCVVGPWRQQTLYPSFSHHYWISAREALIVPEVDHQGPHSLYRVRQDAAGRGAAPTPWSLTPPETASDFLRVSPDGRLVAYLEPDTDNGAHKNNLTPARCRLVVVGIDGSKIMRCPWVSSTWDISLLVWAPDSRSMVVLQCRPEACFWRIDAATGHVKKVTPPAELRFAYADQSVVLGFTAPETLLIAREGPYFGDKAFNSAFGAQSSESSGSVNYPRVSLLELWIGERPALVRTYSPAVPPGAGIGLIALSPRGNRLFWGALCAKIASPQEVRLHRYLPFVAGGNTVVEKGWVSKLDGTDLKELGYYNIPGYPSAGLSTNSPWIVDPKWTPDGKSISFIYKDRLLTVPAD